MKYFLGWILLCSPLFGQKHELGFTLGRIAPSNRGAVESEAGTALQANYGIRLWSNTAVALIGEVHMLASPLRNVSVPARSPQATTDYATLFVTPGLRVKLNPGGRIQPYGVAGGGYALFEHSNLNLGGQPNSAPRHRTTGVFNWGGGVDVSISRILSLRGEVRDFISGNPTYNVFPVNGSQHNVVFGGGFVLRFGD